ncbi:hypothetical protein LTR91_015549 [Friedmanniomyces endolithicus]|uniref:F-box domain-containing protein n=1 Tax=Friedmanniomyces endolithicus TaxID=329885 RepID=A0AAN6K9J7_9PEZI|nr:hypothetical protein LTR38_005458 [Friedmanniomyces endolithicus]KAK0886154.1 hypothetical protein LTR87_000219 [Friedmanniomyces endolithicus]KAK0928711.1 hypothetical protein LTR57_002329 [Friedmanniomyces endolithicus]KAK0971319.1 hypothetical protein LTR91_015549 [Friedmanniomyces endolithicus]KAK1027343.1 hypothetical protein LTS16_021549 [Friedmanniomyces endolithicus]
MEQGIVYDQRTHCHHLKHTNLTNIPEIHSQHPTSAMDGSSFNRIPAELRNEIFELALTSSGPVELRRGNEPGLLQASRQIRQETQSVFWAGNDFIINVTVDSGVQIAKEIAALDLDRLRLIPHIIVKESFVLRSRRNVRGPNQVNDLEVVLDALAARGAVKQQIVLEVAYEIADNVSAHTRGSPQRVAVMLEERKKYNRWLWECALLNYPA